MATTPPNPGGTSPASGNGSSNPPAKPRATIVMKNSGAPGGAPAAPPPTSQRMAAPRSSAPSQRRAPVTTDREALGLSAARPSEMVAGLEEAAKRAEALAAREASKRKSGGKMSANEALHVDDTGKKWALWVKLGLSVAAILIVAAGALMYKGVTTPRIDTRVAVQETKGILADLEMAAKKMPQFESSESVSLQSAKERLSQYLNAQLKNVNESISRDHSSNRNPDKGLLRKREELERMLTFKDGFGKPLALTVENDELSLRSVSTAEGIPTEPVKVRLRGAPADKAVEPQ